MPSTIRRLTFAVSASALLLAASPADAQFQLVSPSPVFTEGQPANLFVEWQGDDVVAGGLLRLPPDWRLVDVASIRQGRREPVSWTFDSAAAAYRVTRSERVAGRTQFVFRVAAPDYDGRGAWSLTPLIAGEKNEEELEMGLPMRAEVVSEPSRLDESDLVAVFGGKTRIELRSRDLPIFTGDRSYTVECWFKSTGLGEVILSAWEGEEETGYPIELVVAPDGVVQFFRGEPGRHVSMSSRRPVADGTWHHVAIVHDEVRGWTRMLVDGVPADSLTGHTTDATAGSARRLCIGGRCEAANDERSDSRSTAYSGRLDMIRFWPTARTVRQIAASMGEKIPPVAGMIAIGFDESSSRDLVVTGARIRREPTDFLFFDPVEDLSATMEAGAVRVEWKAGNRNTTEFVIERSRDGVLFEEVGRQEPSGRHGSYEFADVEPPGGVVYYRIRQMLANGGNRPSGTLKVGVGEELPTVTNSRLAGNFPNPFGGRTTVRFEVRETEQLSVSVWDLSGHQVALLYEGQASAGTHEVPFESGDLPSGTYFVRLQTDEGVSTRTITLTR